MKKKVDNPLALFTVMEYAIAERISFRQAVEWLMRRRDSVYAQIRHTSYSEAVPVSQNTLEDGQIVRTGGLRTGHEVTYSFVDLKKGNFDALIQEIDKAADNLLPQIMRHLFEMIGRTSEATGNSVNANGSPFSFELYLATLRKVDIKFDANGNPQMPQLVISPAQESQFKSLPPITAEQQLALDDLIEEKRREFFAGRRNRTLSRRVE